MQQFHNDASQTGAIVQNLVATTTWDIVPLVFTFIFSDEQTSLTLAQMHLRNQPLNTFFSGAYS